MADQLVLPRYQQSRASPGLDWMKFWMFSFTQYMGNTVGIAVANAVLSVIIDQNLQENSFKLGKYIVDGLNAMKKKHSSMGDIRYCSQCM